MRVSFKDLPQQLRKGLLPSYFISGDEPLQMGEAADAIRAAARAAGFDSRSILEVDAHFKWGTFLAEADSLSLFSTKKIIDLRIPSGKPGLEGSKALLAYCARPPADTLLLLSLPKLDRSQAASKWFKALEKLGAVMQVWPVEGGQLTQWLEQRMLACGLKPSAEVAGILAERVEGNLLAAAQEIDKLLLLQGPGPLTTAQLLAAAGDSARYDVFKLVDAALEGKAARCLRILEGLRAEGVAELVVLWALARETRTLAAIRSDMERGMSASRAVAMRPDIWQPRQPLVTRGVTRLSLARLQRLLQRCALADQAIKGFAMEDPWLLFQDIAVELAGVASPQG